MPSTQKRQSQNYYSKQLWHVIHFISIFYYSPLSFLFQSLHYTKRAASFNLKFKLSNIFLD